MKVSYTFLHSNSICHKCSARPSSGERRMIGAPNLLFFICKDDITHFIFYKGDTAVAWWNTWETLKTNKQTNKQKQKHHNFGIKKHEISYLDAKNEITLTMVKYFFPFHRRFGASLVMLIYLSNFLFPSFFPFNFLFLFFSFSLSFPIFFLSFFCVPLVTLGGPSPQGPQDTSLLSVWINAINWDTRSFQLNNVGRHSN